MAKAIQSWFRYSITFDDNDIVYVEARNASSAISVAKKEKGIGKVICVVKFGSRPAMWVKRNPTDTILQPVDFSRIQYVTKCRTEEELRKLVQKIRRNFLDAYRLAK